MKPLWIVLGVVALIIVVLLFIGGSYIGAKNTLVTKNEAVNNAFSQVDIEQQRRLDLIPNLVASVKGYVSEESTILTNIANARAGVLAAGSDHASSINANTKLDVALGPFFRLQEQYPDLKGNQQFMRLTDELAGGKSNCRGTPTVQRDAAGLQHIREAVPQQHLGKHGRISLQGRVLQRQSRKQCGAEGRLLEVDEAN